MPRFDFEDVDTGESRELLFGVGKAPGYGETTEFEGRLYRRVVEVPAPARVAPDRKHVSRSLPRLKPHQRGKPGMPDCDDMGRPRFETAEAARQWAARSDGLYEYG